MAESGPPGTEFNNENFEKLVALSDNLRFFSNSAIRSQLDAAAQRVETARVTLYWIWGTSSVFVAAFVVIFAWFIAKPIRRIDSHIRRLGQGHFDEMINIEGPSNIAELGARLDWLRNRLGEVDQIKERFFREMSHQLKTPLASIREGADLLKDESVRGDPDRQDDFVAFNCAAIPTDLLESELFGYRKGAFSGATRNHPGLFEQAHKGTLLLDEIGDMPKILQAKVLRVIEDGKVRPLGSEQVVDVDARIISATNRNLEEAMEAGEFREDLFYRLNVVSVDLPSLSDRIEDIPPLAASRLHRLAEEAGSSRNSFSPEAMELLMSQKWPGNVRQLQNVVDQTAALSPSRVISAEIVESTLGSSATKLPSLSEARDEFMRGYLIQLLAATNGNVTQASKLARRNRTDFHKLLAKHDIDAAAFKR